MTQPFRLQVGGLIDRGRLLNFRFDGRWFEGHPGDTLASALLANGVRLVGRSFKYHRPRGIFSAGVEEPSALVRLESGAAAEPNRRLTDIAVYEGLRAFSQHAWPGLRADLGALVRPLAPLFPAGFYYKTFMAPPALWRALWEPLLRHLAGLGAAPRQPDPQRYDKAHIHCDVLVVGGGPSGLAAAQAAGMTGARVLLADGDPLLGGSLLRRPGHIAGGDGLAWADSVVAALRAMPEVRLLAATTIVGRYDDNYLVGVERVGDLRGPTAPSGLPRLRLWHIRARQVVLATGALERPPVFAGNDRPGVMLAGAVETYLQRYAVLAGRRVVLFVNHDEAYALAAALAAAGAVVGAIVDPRAEAGPTARRLVAGMPLYPGHQVVATAGGQALRGVRVAPVSGRSSTVVDCDLLAVSAGWTPNLGLYAQMPRRLRFDERIAAFVPDTAEASGERGLAVVGAAGGTFGLRRALADGLAAGARAALLCGFGNGETPMPPPAVDDEAEAEKAPAPVEAPLPSGRAARQAFVDLHNDVTAFDVALAAREGYAEIEHLKRYTTLGMGPDQGKTSGLAGAALLASVTGRRLAATGMTTVRPPYVPVAYGVLAGRAQGTLADPLRITPMHDWHVAAGAVFEDVGQWRRARYYPQLGEDMERAVRRECLAARDRVALFDASTLGKIEVGGADAGRFLDRIYVNHWQRLGIGQCRYGLMCRDDGMVFDDGVGTRLAADRFFLTTTTGNAGAVLDWLEEWLQTEWPDLDVFCVSVSEEWANATLVGPLAREVLTALSLDPAHFPFMRMREAAIAGIPARIFRISFSGELSYEINIPADCGLALWQSLMEAGAEYGITPCGTEAMHVLRAEKGFIAIGQETDGSVTPLDLGLGRMLASDKDFLGRRPLARLDLVRPDRKQLVGLLPDDPDAVLPEGAQLVAELGGTPPVAMIGHVTSSYWGARLGRSFALALVEGGRARHGQRVWAPLPDRLIAAQICPPVFYDIDNRRRDG
ncbi:MAG: sarcosine oxidase subunit alpha family protein [Thiohalocapsa sp.]